VLGRENLLELCFQALHADVFALAVSYPLPGGPGLCTLPLERAIEGLVLVELLEPFAHKHSDRGGELETSPLRFSLDATFDVSWEDDAHWILDRCLCTGPLHERQNSGFH